MARMKKDPLDLGDGSKCGKETSQADLSLFENLALDGDCNPSFPILFLV